jgi:hypothetical protein
MHGFMIGTALFIGWWILMAVAFGIVGLVIAALFGGIPDLLHMLLWLVYIGAVLIGGIGVVCDKDYIIQRFKRSAS